MTTIAPSIAIIGAGPAGITTALELKDNGYKDITIYGSFEEAQLKTVEVDGITFDVAACLMHTGYRHTIEKLVKRFGLTVNFLTAPADITDNHLNPIKKGTSEKLKTYLLILLYFLFFFIWWLTHKSRLGRFFHISMESFLSKVGLKSLANSFVMGPGGIAQGYGFLDEVTAYHAMRWFRPRLFFTPLLSKYQKGVATIKEGYQRLFCRILSKNDFQVISAKIKRVQPIANGKKVELTNEFDEKKVYDLVVIACPLDKVQFPADHLIQKNTIDTSRVFSFLFTSDTPAPFEDRAYLTDHIQNKVKDKALVIRTGGKTSKGEYLFWGVGYQHAKTSKQQLRKNLFHQMEEECKLSIKKVHFFRSFRYNLRFNQQAVKDGIPYQFNKLQGKDNIWYSGGLLSHWDTSSIYEYNRSLVNKMVLAYGKKPKLSLLLNYYWKGLLGQLRLL